MKKLFAGVAGIALVSTSALSQVRPEDCIPVFPLVDQVAAVNPIQDVLAERAVPVDQPRRGFFGLPLLPLLAAGGVGGVIGALAEDDDEDIVSPA